MTTPALDLAPAARTVADLLPGIGDDRLGAPTPCTEYTVSDLLHHLLGLSVAFRDAAAKVEGPTTSTPPPAAGTGGEPLPAEWRTLLPERLLAMAEAWRDPAAWDGMTKAGGVALPGSVAGLVACNEIVLHGWDLARAAGLPVRFDDASLTASVSLFSAPGPRGPAFADPLPVADDAPLLDRALALSGRDPSWTAPQ